MQESALRQFLAIMVLPDNIPIVGMLVLLMFFTYMAFKEARKNDDLVARGREEDILEEMQK